MSTRNRQAATFSEWLGAAYGRIDLCADMVINFRTVAEASEL